MVLFKREWKLESLLRALYQILKDSPARREGYGKAIESENSPMPLKFCKTRSVENIPLLERGLEVLPNMSKYVKAVEEKKFPDPDTKCFKVITEAAKDSLMMAKIYFVLSVSKEVTPFLTLYQADKPMVPFVATDLFQLLKDLMCSFIKPNVMKDVKSVDKRIDVEVNTPANQLNHTKVDVSYTAERITKQLSTNRQTEQLKVLKFRMACKKCLVTIVEKLLEKSPLKYFLVSYLRFLDPRNMSNSAAK